MTPARGGTVVDRVVPAQLACRIGARARAGEGNAWAAVVAIALGGLALFASTLQGSPAVGSAVGGIVYDAAGPGGTLVLAGVVAALGALTLLGRAGAAISAAPAPAVKTVPADPHDRTQHSGRGGPAGAAARRDRWSRGQRTTTTLKLPFAAIPGPRPERKELP